MGDRGCHAGDNPPKIRDNSIRRAPRPTGGYWEGQYQKGCFVSLPRVKLVGKEKIADGTMAFHFEKPDGFEFKAGQFADYTILNPSETDEEGNIRGFSFASAPFEPHLVAATRMRDTAFKRVLRDLAVGTELELDGPYGGFTLHNKAARPAVFLTGGIGITPVRSILLQAAHDRTAHQLVLFYSNKRPEDAAFLDELTVFGETNPNLTFVPTMTQPGTSSRDWGGETGHVDQAMLSKYVDDLSAPIYYLCGPAGMVAGMRTMLSGAGVDDDDIRTEEFTGY
jgi:ferredoxin-NADP reductase